MVCPTEYLSDFFPLGLRDMDVEQEKWKGSAQLNSVVVGRITTLYDYLPK